MSQNLKARLKQIHNTRSSRTLKNENSISEEKLTALWPGWEEAGFMTLKREVIRELSFPFPCSFPDALAIIIPDFANIIKNGTGLLPLPEELLFFDLETTGLSGGAGTIAFLAAFGRFIPSGEKNTLLSITQYLLLDYPGEYNFVERIAEEFSGSKTPVLITYNGKSFDSQIFHNRCLMNRVKIPEYYHGDLLHPARRLWKNILPNCSQATIEVSVLGLDRTGDVSGALAPDIWFSFLRNSNNDELLQICEHNEKDITGLAHLFLTMKEIAKDPLKSREKISFDEEALAFTWEKAVKYNTFLSCPELKTLGDIILKNAAKKGFRRASSYKYLAINAEWKEKNFSLALDYTRKALELSDLNDNCRYDLEKRLSRLERKNAYS